MTTILGIDPGRSSGGIAVVNGSDACAWPMPDTDHDIWALIEKWAFGAHLAVIERVSAMPGQGVSSSFKFGASFGELKMALVAARVRIELVSPAVWQGKLNCRTGGQKNVTKALAQRLFPKVKVTHAVADALLLAEYGRRFLLPQPVATEQA